MFEFPTITDANRERLRAEAWRKTCNDYKGHLNGQRSIMILRNGSTQIVYLSELTDEEISKFFPTRKADRARQHDAN